MPAKSKAQFRLMKMLENNPKLAKEYGISREQAREFTEENIGNKRFSKLKERLSKGK